MTDGTAAASYGNLWAPAYDRLFSQLDPTPAVEALTDLVGDGPALELGIGTGRVALPLRARGVDVHGVDSSPAMTAELRAKPGGTDIPLTIGDMADPDLAVGGPFSLVYVVFNTLFMLPTQSAQLRCFAKVAELLSPGGRFVIECFVPDLSRFRDGNQSTRAVLVDSGEVRLDVSQHDPVDQRVNAAQVIVSSAGGVEMRPVELRYAWPAELDLMAQLAGLRLAHRWGGWTREPFTAQSGKHVSVYEAA